MNARTNRTSRKRFMVAIAAIGATSVLAGSALADDFVVRHRHHGGHNGVRISVTRPIATSTAYTENVRKIWHEPVYEERRIPVRIPARTITRQVPRYSTCGQFVGYDLVEDVIEPARIDWRIERVLVRAGYYETVVERVPVRRSNIVRVGGPVRRAALPPTPTVIRKARPNNSGHHARIRIGF